MRGIEQTGHLKAPLNWINDPNGFIYYRGQYHLFYQYFPYAPSWGTMHWGHAVSPDLIHWEHEGIALFPTKLADRNGCFSGSAIERAGRLHLFYTGVRYLETDPENIHKHLNNRFESCQMELVSADGRHFDNLDAKRVIIPAITDPELGDATHTRDPKVWRGRDGYHLVLGTTVHREGRLLIYRSDDLVTWELAGTVERDGLGWMWECPDWFEVDGTGVVMVSPMGLLDDGAAPTDMAICMLADFDEDTCRMTLADSYQFFDYGLDLYAPQSALDAEGRRTVIAWLRMPAAVEAAEGTWRGMMSLPRVVEVAGGHIYFRIHPNVRAAYRLPVSPEQASARTGYHLAIELHEGESLDLGGYRIARTGGHIVADRSAVCPHNGKCRLTSETPEVREGDRLDIFVDANMVETYVNDGEYVLSHAVFGLEDRIDVHAAATPELHALG